MVVKKKEKVKKVRNNYSKYSDILIIIEEMSQPGAWVTYQDIMKIAECSHKTAERIKEFIATKYYNFYMEQKDPKDNKTLQFRLDGTNILPDNDFVTEKEMLSLNAAVNTIKDDFINVPLKNLQYKLIDLLQKKKSNKEMNDFEGTILEHGVICRPHLRIQMNDSVLEVLRRAILDEHKISCSYIGSGKKTPKKYILCPLGVLYGMLKNYLVAYDDKDLTTPHQFILSNISNVQELDESFNTNGFDIKEYSKESFGAYHSGNGPVGVEWKVSADVAEEAEKYIFHPRQRIKRNPDGTLTVKMKADGWLEMAWYLFTWGGKIVPTKPKELVDAYKNALNQALKSLENK